jgi:hypothetical protein
MRDDVDARLSNSITVFAPIPPECEPERRLMLPKWSSLGNFELRLLLRLLLTDRTLVIVHSVTASDTLRSVVSTR